MHPTAATSGGTKLHAPPQCGGRRVASGTMAPGGGEAVHSARARMGCYSNVLMEGRGRQGARRDGVWA
eukprot:scaffold46292_cov39-Phaeocystis_antarctica.AAC.1